MKQGGKETRRAASEADTIQRDEAQRLLVLQIAAAVAESGGQWGGAIRLD